MTAVRPAQDAERILMVSPYPPWRDGIGAYAVQQVRALRRLGHHVEVVSPDPSAAHHHLDLIGPRGASPSAAWPGVRSCRGAVPPGRVLPGPRDARLRIAEGLALGAAFRAGPPVEIRLHEVDQPMGRPIGPVGQGDRFLFRSADRVTVHVPDHHALMVDAVRRRPPTGSTLVHHGADFVRRVDDDRSRHEPRSAFRPTATCSCASASSSRTRASIGPSRRFAGSATEVRSLHVVGAVRVDDPTAADHRRELDTSPARSPASTCTSAS